MPDPDKHAKWAVSGAKEWTNVKRMSMPQARARPSSHHPPNPPPPRTPTQNTDHESIQTKGKHSVSMPHALAGIPLSRRDAHRAVPPPPPTPHSSPQALAACDHELRAKGKALIVKGDSNRLKRDPASVAQLRALGTKAVVLERCNVLDHLVSARTRTPHLDLTT